MNNKAPELSILLDDLSLNYDAISPGRLDSIIPKSLTEEQLSRIQSLILLWQKSKISKYNYAREFEGDLPERYVLIALQAQDLSVDRSGGTVVKDMIVAALQQNPACTAIVCFQNKLSNEHAPGCLNQSFYKDNSRIQLITKNMHPVRLIKQAEAIYTYSSSIGFEGLLWGKNVHTFTPSFFSGRGLTEDRHNSTVTPKPLSLEYLVYAVLVDYYQYTDPETESFCEIERILEWLGLQRRMRERFPVTIYALGISIHKKPVVRDYFQGCNVHFCNKVSEIPSLATVAYWSRKYDADMANCNASQIIHLEDGFIRSVGLGADLVRPLSWVMDKVGIYFDATQPSEQEMLLLTSEFDEDLLNRAQTIRQQLVTHALTKYNVGSDGWQKPDQSLTQNGHRQKFILVPGQVESDASLAYGAPGIKRNVDLLRAVKESNPEAYVIYKPHPDVVAGLRYAGQNEENAETWCDEVVVDVAMGDLLLQVDEVHTLTSLTGFEALLRGKKVTCYGQPFYSGWGLTHDKIPVVRRERKLSLDALVAGVLILYPVYVSRTTGKFTTPERALEELLVWRNHQSPRMPLWKKILRCYLQWTKTS